MFKTHIPDLLLLASRSNINSDISKILALFKFCKKVCKKVRNKLYKLKFNFCNNFAPSPKALTTHSHLFTSHLMCFRIQFNQFCNCKNLHIIPTWVR